MSVVEQQLKLISTMTLGELRTKWQQLKRSNAPTAMSKELLCLAISYQMQEHVSGRLSRRTLLRIKALASRKVGDKPNCSVSATLLPKPGAKFLREWQGKTHEVLILANGQFAFDGKAYRSLSVIAREITGAHWSGPRFFGLKAAINSQSGARSDG